MKDIRQELVERLKDIQTRHNSLQSELNRLAETEKSLKMLIRIEEERWGEQEPLFTGMRVPRAEEGRTPLSRFLLASLREKPKPVAVLKEEALNAGLLKESKYPNRAVHFALVGMKTGNRVEKSNGVWKLKKQSSEDTHS